MKQHILKAYENLLKLKYYKANEDDDLYVQLANQEQLTKNQNELLEKSENVHLITFEFTADFIRINKLIDD